MEKECTNLIDCPICKQAATHRLTTIDGIYLSIMCAQCELTYNSIIEPKSQLGGSYISQATYERVCEEWQHGACKDQGITYIPLQFD